MESLRQAFKLRAEQVPERERVRAGVILAQHWLEADQRRFQSVGVFWPMPHELPLAPLFRGLLERGMTLFFPRILTGNRLAFVPVFSPMDRLPTRLLTTGEEILDSDLALHLYPDRFQRRGKLLEPIWTDAVLEGVPELVFVPALAYAESGHRLGHGGGYYDRLIHLARQQNLPLHTVGLAAPWQVDSTWAIQAWDEPVDELWILSEMGDCDRIQG